jgi:hypothetical protein
MDIDVMETLKGWHHLVHPLLEQCKAEGVEVLQVKEKFGTLRFYTAGNLSGSLRRMIDEAENQSSKVCEVCGKEGQLRSDLSWLKTLCQEHYKERKDKRNYG